MDVNMDSILDSVKKDLNICVDDTSFDPELIMHINSVFSILQQLGVGPKNGFAISDNTAVWSDFLGTNALLNIVKSYVPKKVKLLFDPPSTGPNSEALNKVVSEYEWRINIFVDPVMEDSNND